MPLPNVLRTKSTEFTNKSVGAKRVDNNIELEILPEEMNFAEMTKRRQPVAPETVLRNLESDGHVFVNIGITAVLTTSFKGQSYLIATSRKGSTISPVCGYVPASKLENPIEVLEEEIAEEFLPVTGEDRVLPGKRGSIPLQKPYANSVAYDPVNDFQIDEQTDVFDLRDVFTGDIKVVDKNGARTIKECSGMYFAAAFNAAQYLFRYKANIPRYPDQLNLTLCHAEDGFNPATGMVESKPIENGLPLIRISKGDLTGEFFSYKDGDLKTYGEQEIFLTQSFASKTRGVVSGKGVSLKEYLS